MCIYVTFVVNPIERITRERIGRVETRRDLFFSQSCREREVEFVQEFEENERDDTD